MPPRSAIVGASFGAWKNAAEVLYGRKNKIGRKTYPADAAVPLVSLFSDASAFNAWNDLRTLPFMREAYGAWLKEKRTKDPDFMKDGVCEAMDFSVMPLHETKAASIRRFLAERETSAIRRMRDHLASIKSKALIGSTLGAWHYRDVAVDRMSALDFSAEGFAIDPPRHLGERWTTPWRLDNLNPLETPDATIPVTIGWREKAGKPFLLGNWSAYAPSSWRAASGLLVGGWAGRHGWDGVWRDDEPTKDPFAVATERAVWALFARGDMAEDAPEEALVIKDGALTVRRGIEASGTCTTVAGSTMTVTGSETAVFRGAHEFANFFCTVPDKTILFSTMGGDVFRIADGGMCVLQGEEDHLLNVPVSFSPPCSPPLTSLIAGAPCALPLMKYMFLSQVSPVPV